MHFRFKGNPNTNNAGRLLTLNKIRAAKGLRPLTLAQFEDKLDAPLVEAERKAPSRQRKIF